MIRAARGNTSVGPTPAVSKKLTIQSMRILYVVPSFYPALYHGGPVVSVYQQCNTLAQKGIDLTVLTTDTAGLGRRLEVKRYPTIMPAGYPVYYCRRMFSVAAAPGLLWRMFGLVEKADVVHLVAVYSFPTIPVLLLCKLMGKPVVWSPKGAFQRWEGSRKIKLKNVWEKLCRLVAPRRLLLHVTSDFERNESSKRFPATPVAVTPNGVGIPSSVQRVPSNGTLRLLYYGRLDPIKGIENLLAACSRLNGGLEWSLTIAGIGEPAYASHLVREIQRLSLADQVRMIGEVKTESQGEVFSHADVLILPSHQESFGMVAAEAMANAIPVIVSDRTPWARVEDIGCGLSVSNDEGTLASAIDAISRMPLKDMGLRGRQWMESEYSWDHTSRQMIELYHRVLAL
jgi:glycosyltransferase involved in cell wall biosynthesis